jgi:hypothetical protein
VGPPGPRSSSDGTLLPETDPGVVSGDAPGIDIVFACLRSNLYSCVHNLERSSRQECCPLLHVGLPGPRPESVPFGRVD